MWYRLLTSPRGDMDASLVSSLYLMPHWLERLVEDYEDEAGDGASAWAVKLLQKEGRKAVWNMSSLLGVDGNGVPGQACTLLERYLSTHMREFVSLSVDIQAWEDFKRALASRIPLLIASCVQLAAKMSSAGMQVNPKLVRTCLICKGVVFSVPDIIASEFQVFSTLGYRVPLWTSVEAAQLLALKLGIPLSMMEGLALVVNIAEYRRDRLNNRVRSIANLSLADPTFNKTTVRTLHLAAGSVAAGSRYLGFKGPDPCSRLAKLVRAPISYLKCICDVILADVLVDDIDIDGHSRKRKIN